MEILLGFIIGAALGSFAKALADRSLNRRTFWGRSYCPNCKHKLGWYDLFPIFSYILLNGKCRYCHKRIGVEYLLVEIGTGILIGFLFWQQSNNFLSVFNIQNFQSFDLTQNLRLLNFLMELLVKVFFITILVILFLTDLKKMFIPDRIIIPSIKIGVVLGLALVIVKITYLYINLNQTPVGKLLLPPKSEYFQRHALMIVEPYLWAIITGIAIAGFFYGLIVITKGKGMGGGDVKLGGFLGVMLGFPSAVFALVLAFITGAVFSLGLIIAGKKHFGQTIPFGPFLVLGALIMLFWGNQIIDWYLHLTIN